MGQDIHIKTLVYSRIEKKYIDPLCLATLPQYSVYKPWFEGRNYDLFSVFGSQRSDYKELKCAHFGLPDDINPTYRAYLADSDYYGFRWYDGKEMYDELETYIENLKDPKKYFAEEIADGEEIRWTAASWKKETKWLVAMLVQIREKLKAMFSDHPPTSSDPILDSSMIKFIVYFDS